MAEPDAQQAGAVIGASTGMFGAVWAQAEPRKVLGALGARVIDEELPVAKAPTAWTTLICSSGSRSCSHS